MTTLNPEHVRIVSEWDLTPVKRRLKKDTGLTDQDIDERIAEYRKFVLLLATCRGTYPVSKPVDVVWHAHMLFSENYDALAKAINPACRLRHTPTLTDEDERRLLPRYREATLPMLRHLFGPPDPRLWPADHCVCGGNGDWGCN